MVGSFPFASTFPLGTTTMRIVPTKIAITLTARTFFKLLRNSPALRTLCPFPNFSFVLIFFISFTSITFPPSSKTPRGFVLGGRNKKQKSISYIYKVWYKNSTFFIFLALHPLSTFWYNRLYVEKYIKINFKHRYSELALIRSEQDFGNRISKLRNHRRWERHLKTNFPNAVPLREGLRLTTSFWMPKTFCEHSASGTRYQKVLVGQSFICWKIYKIKISSKDISSRILMIF